MGCSSTDEVQQLQAENAALRDALEQLRATAMDGLDISQGHADDTKASVSRATICIPPTALTERSHGHH